MRWRFVYSNFLHVLPHPVAGARPEHERGRCLTTPGRDPGPIGLVERNHGHDTAGIRRKRTALLCPRRPGIEHGRSRERHISSYGNLARQKKSVAFEGFASTDRRQAHIYLLTIKGEM